MATSSQEGKTCIYLKTGGVHREPIAENKATNTPMKHPKTPKTGTRSTLNGPRSTLIGPRSTLNGPMAVDSSTQLQDCMLLLYQRQCNADEGGFWGIADGGETAEKRRPFWAFWVFFFGLFCLVLTSLSRRGACAHSAYAKKGSFRSALPENPSVSRAASRIGRPV